MMLFAVAYTAGRFAGTRMVNAPTEDQANEKVKARLRDELPGETAITTRVIPRTEALP